MEAMHCDYQNCTFPAKEKCSSCGNIFCVKHIQLVNSRYMCDLCVAERAERELFRMELKEAYIGETMKKPLCIITSERILLRIPSAEYRLSLSDIVSVEPKFLFEILGIHYWVGVFTGGYSLNDWGNIHLDTYNKQQRDQLLSQIKQALMQLNSD
jgi:hypothetical protein